MRASTARGGGGRGRRGRGRALRAWAPHRHRSSRTPRCSRARNPSRSDATASAVQPGRHTTPAGRGSGSRHAMRLGLAALDAIDLPSTCRQRVLTLQSAPPRIRVALRTALRAGLRLAVHPACDEDAVRGWKLFCLETRVPPEGLDRRCDCFNAGRWVALLHEAAAAVTLAPNARRSDTTSDAARARRATSLVPPLPPAPSPLSPFRCWTFWRYQRASPHPSRGGCPAAARRRPPACPCGTPPSGARRPSGRPPGCAPKAQRQGPSPRRRLVGRVLARHFASQFQDACMPHQYGLSTRTGTEAVSRLLRAATETCPRATISSQLMLSARLTTFRMARCSERCLPDASSTRSSPSLGSSTSPSVYTWCDDDGCPHEVIQGEGGEQGDPLMPAFYALA